MSGSSLSGMIRLRSGPPAGGCSTPHPDIISVKTSAGDHLFSRPAPPLVHQAVVVGPATRSGPAGLSLVAEWIVSQWPGRGRVPWRQVFRDGCEVGTASSEELCRLADIEIEITYSDFVGFLYGLSPFEEASEGVNISRGGIGVMSCLSGLAFRETALRIESTPPFERRAIAAVCASPGLSVRQ